MNWVRALLHISQLNSDINLLTIGINQQTENLIEEGII